MRRNDPVLWDSASVYETHEPGNGTSYELLVTCGVPHGDVLALVNFRVAMRLPDHWRNGVSAFYIAEKLGVGEVDGQAISDWLALQGGSDDGA